MIISTCLIGEDSLLIQCGEILLANRHSIEVIVSKMHKINLWAKKHNIPLIKDVKELKNSTYKFDYIFSVVNSILLPASIINLARFAAINYHDSLLPKYAGLNATTWAILNSEEEHGVTWHLMDAEIDKGDIVKQKTFSIAENDTALDLNLKCYQLAIDSFRELIKDIENQKLDKVKQNLQQRSYYGSADELPNFGFIDWKNQTAEDIYRLARAVTFGHYKNDMGTLKLYLKNFYIIPKVEILDDHPVTNALPGTVFSITERDISISTLTKPIKISKFIATDGSTLDIKNFISQTELQEGDVLGTLNDSDLILLKENYHKSLKNENYWSKQLNDINPYNLFSNRELCTNFSNETYEINLKKIFPNIALAELKDILLSSILIYLFRLNDHEPVNLYFASKEHYQLFNDKCANIFSYLLPFNFFVSQNVTLKDILIITKKLNLSFLKKNPPLLDMVARIPELEGKSLESNEIVISYNADITLSRAPLLFFYIDSLNGIIQIRNRFNLAVNTDLTVLFSNISQHLTHILIALIKNSHLSVRNFSFLTEHEKYQLLNIFCSGKRKLTLQLTIPEVFRNQLECNPNKAAILMGCKTTSYQQLGEMVDKISQYILNKNIPENSFIAIYMERSVEMVATIMAILAAKCTYIPIDMKYPTSRVEYIVRESNVAAIITNDTLSPNISTIFEDKAIQSNIYSVQVILDADITNLKFHASSQNHLEKLAYIMFTSGTTGKPKGVMVTEKNVLNYCYWFLESSHFTAESIVDFSSSFAFDLSIPCIIAPLLVGGTIAICEEGKKTDPQSYIQHLKSHKVTHVEMTPGYLHLLLNFPEEVKQLTYLNYLFLGADTISKSDISRWLELCPQHQLVNEYGPTESTVAITSYFIKANDLLTPDSLIPIGRPAYNTECYILDKYRNLCPIGMWGELYVAGDQVAKGYLNQETLTQEKFLKSNLSNENKMIYKTGDLSYWLPDGNLQFLGRKDHQVKVQGYRVEVSEIESVLIKIPSVNQAIVVLDEGKFKEKYLRAYLECGTNSISVEEIKTFLEAHLPSYMIPREFCLIEEVPLKENEKIDYKALSKYNHQRLTRINTIPAEENYQTVILSLWKNIFESDSISIDDDFFSLGGDSLKALQIIYEVEDFFKIEIPVRYIFENPTVSSFSNKVSVLHKNINLTTSKNKKPNKKAIVQLSKGNSKTPIFLVHPVGGTIFWYKRLASLLEDEYTVYGIQDPSIDLNKMLFGSIEDMANYYLQEIKKVYSGSEYYLGGASFGSTVAYEMAHQLQQLNQEVKFLGLFDGWAIYPEKIMHVPSHTLTSNNRFENISSEKKQLLTLLEESRKALLLQYKIPLLETKVSLFKAMELWSSFQHINDHYNGWKPHVVRPIQVYNVPGNHETMLFDPNVQILARLIIEHFETNFVPLAKNILSHRKVFIE